MLSLILVTLVKRRYLHRLNGQQFNKIPESDIKLERE